MLKRILVRAAAIGIGCGVGRWLNIIITNPLTAVPTWQLAGIAVIAGFLGGLVVFGLLEILQNRRK